MKQEKSPEDEAFEALEKRQQIASEKTPISLIDILPVSRNETLEEVAAEFDKMTSLGDTAASFAAFVRGMKK